MIPARSAVLRNVLGEGTRYLTASAAALAVDFSVYAGLVRLASVDYLIAAPVGFALGLATIYLLSVRWVFGARSLPAMIGADAPPVWARRCGRIAAQAWCR